MTDTTDAALDALVDFLKSSDMATETQLRRMCVMGHKTITAIRADNSDLRAKVAQLEMAAKSSGKVIVDMAGLPTPSADFMAAMMPAFEAIAVQEMQKQVDGLEAERDAALARQSADYARRVEVKPLVWQGKDGYWRARSSDGCTYEVSEISGQFHMTHIVNGRGSALVPYPSLVDAVAAASSHRKARIYAELTAAPPDEYTRGRNAGLEEAAKKLPELFDEWESDPTFGLDDMCRIYFPNAIRALAIAPPASVVGVKPLVLDELENIEKQLHVNEGYFEGGQRTTLEILQGHIKDSVARIRAALKGRDA